MFNPIATYRLQFHKEFTFKDLLKTLPYLHDLGVKTIYASPVFEAVPGSNHGYDVTDPHKINPEIGTLDELSQISSKLKELGMYWIQDIVPNHMAFHPNNHWLMDVMENGHDSVYSGYFDILWEVPQFSGKLMVPFLGAPLKQLIEDRQVSLSLNNNGKLQLNYGEQYYPINRSSANGLLERAGNSNSTAISKLLDEINHDPEQLNAVIEQQYYQLCFWQDSERMINYRRFFTVNSLICLNIQNEAVFNDYHRFIKELLDKGYFQGLRVDHIDGLADPKTYLERLRALAGEETYIVVEKILESGEQFPADWPVQGNTGYDFLGIVNNVLTSKKSKSIFTDFYNELSGEKESPLRAVPEKKAAILYGHMRGELDNLTAMFENRGLLGGNRKRFAPDSLRETIAEFLIRCPVYRFYGNKLPLAPFEAAAVKSIFKEIASEHTELAPVARYISRLFTGSIQPNLESNNILAFYQRCMQFTGPLMAKGVEDTLMYTYNRFIAHNEVGDSPAEFGLAIKQFHAYMSERQQNWPLSMNATATHDTKRGEDVRARLNVVSDTPDQWLELVREWLKEHQKPKKGKGPDANDAYLIYQTILGVWPFPGENADDLTGRLEAYLIKALREAKTHTDWAAQNDDYENAVQEFTKGLLKNSTFRQGLEKYILQNADVAVINSLTQLLLKFTCPGVPDIYQGCEGWDLSLVDPDNRRPVDFTAREKWLKKHLNSGISELWPDRYKGTIKTWLTRELLTLRQSDPELFVNGQYVPLTVAGKYAENVVAFARCYQREWLIVAAPLHLGAIDSYDTQNFDWEDTRILLPDDAPLQWVSIFHKDKSVFNKAIPLAQNFELLPMAIWRSAAASNQRSAGIIMHITSLPSSYGIGDLGPGARDFAGFLSSAGQRYWQLLPVNPTDEAAGYSPYSGSSSMAGNTLLISPDDLVRDGLVTPDEAAACRLAETDAVVFEKVLSLKAELFERAYNTYLNLQPGLLQEEYEHFKKEEEYWLEDFAIYEVLKSIHGGDAWYSWPKSYKNRDKDVLAKLRKQHERDLDKTMWLQFIFFRQWNELKAFGNQSGITFFGDLPFYVSYDSADVWTHPELFDLNEDHKIAGVAGVPPDYFNADGQLWGMPVYRWAEHERTNFFWWVSRIKRNRDFFDVIRLDHFRAFYDYWRVNAGETTAVNGQWCPGPGGVIFRIFERELDGLPFIAEDLGDVSEGVYQLRDEFNLPGMNVLQYAFGEDMPVSIHIPHNHVANSVTYTGTHDNNTTLGWFAKDSTPVEQTNLSAYLRVRVNQNNVNRLMAEICYSSVSHLAMLPLQDILNLDQDSRMNMPSSAKGNWLWRVREKQISPSISAQLLRLVKQYNR